MATAYCWGLRRGDLGLKNLRTSWKRGGGEKRWDGGKETSDVKHYLLEQEFDLPPVVPEGEGRCGLGGDGQSKTGCHGIWACVSHGSSFPEPWLPHCKTGTPSPGFTPCACPIFQGEVLLLYVYGSVFPFLPHFFVPLPGRARKTLARVCCWTWGDGFSGSFWPRDWLLLMLPKS